MHRQHIDNAGGDNDIGICRDQFAGGGLAPLRILAGDTALDDEIAPLDPAQPRQRLVKPATRERLAGGDEADTGALARFLRTGVPAEGRSRRAEQHIAAPHYSMTSSARSRIAGGIVSPSALAVFRLTTSWNLVGCSTGRSAGLAPERILPTKEPPRL